METQKTFTTEEARVVGACLGVKWTNFDAEQFRKGMDIELEHGLRNPHTNITNDEPITTAKIALVHLNEFPDYYNRLERLESEAKKFWDGRRNMLE